MTKKIKELLKILNKDEFSIDKNIIKNHCIDWRGEFKGNSDVVVFPKSVKKISQILKFCFRYNLKIVPQGGNTGLVGGGVPRKNKNEIIINLSKLDKIREIDSIGNSITLESGCILDNVKNELYKKKLEFPLSMGSRGSCQIGGNIATNAGGVNVIKYGTFRQNILGIEAVLADGSIFSSLKNIKKNNTGLDLKQLLIGSEGILGIITAATIQVFPLPSEKVVIWSSFKNFKDVLNFYHLMTTSFNNLITSFEFMNKESIEILEKNEIKITNLKKNDCYCLVELSNFYSIENFNEFIFSRIDIDKLNTQDFIISKSESENKKLWSYRESIPIAERKENFIVAHDISIPLIKIESFINETSKKIQKYSKGTKIINFGHLGDNNLHYNVLIKNYSSSKRILVRKAINEIVYESVNKFNGSISAEHGIGQLKKNELRKHKNLNEIKKMKYIKNIFDPKNILNPGKVI